MLRAGTTWGVQRHGGGGEAGSLPRPWSHSSRQPQFPQPKNRVLPPAPAACSPTAGTRVQSECFGSKPVLFMFADSPSSLEALAQHSLFLVTRACVLIVSRTRLHVLHRPGWERVQMAALPIEQSAWGQPGAGQSATRQRVSWLRFLNCVRQLVGTELRPPESTVQP